MELQDKTFRDELLEGKDLFKSWRTATQEERKEMLGVIADITSRYYLSKVAPGAEYKPADLAFGGFSRTTGADYSPSEHKITLMQSPFQRSSTFFHNVAHEATHHAQTLAAQHMVAAKVPVEQRPAFDVFEHHFSSTMFGINISGNIYDDGRNKYTSFDQYSSLRSGFYHLCASEREAELTACEISEICGFGKRKPSFQFHINMLKSRYVFGDMSQDEIFKTIDNAYTSIYTGQRPNNALEASIAYDLVALYYGERSEEKYKESLQMLRSDVKAEALSKAGFEHAVTLPHPNLAAVPLPVLMKMTKAEIEQNPHAIAYGLCWYGKEQLMQSDYIREQLEGHEIGDSSFDRWYFSDKNFLSQPILNVVAMRMGEEYRIERGEHFEQQAPSLEEKDIDLDSLFASSYTDHTFEQVMDRYKPIDLSFLDGWTPGQPIPTLDNQEPQFDAPELATNDEIIIGDI